MSKFDLRYATIRIKDGLAGTGAAAEAGLAAATDLDIDGLALNNTDSGTEVPVGARFTIAGEAGSIVHVVTDKTDSTGVTTNIVFTPAIATGGILDDAVITFLPQQISIKVGEGNVTYTEAREYEYGLDRGLLDSVREGNEVPLSVDMQFVYEFVRTGTAETITPVDAIKGIGGAASWISSDQEDNCAPYAVDIEIDFVPSCSGQSVEGEKTLLPKFRRESLAFDLSAASISCQGKCFATEALITRE